MEIPLFPLHTVLCPGIALPLHVFEPRYRLLTERCVANDAPFGIVLIREGREVGSDDVSIAGIGTFAEIRQASRYPDGRYDLLVVGSGRFAIEDVDPDGEPYLVGRVTELPDDVGDRERAVALAARTMRRFVGYLQLLQPMDGETAEEIDVRIEVDTEPDEPDPDVVSGLATAEGDDRPDDAERGAGLEEATRRLVIPDDPTTLSYLLSGIVQVDSLQRQVLLEAETTEDRLEALDDVLDRELWMLRRRLRHFAPDQSFAAVRRN
jgi:uncharacterized protein